MQDYCSDVTASDVTASDVTAAALFTRQCRTAPWQVTCLPRILPCNAGPRFIPILLCRLMCHAMQYVLTVRPLLKPCIAVYCTMKSSMNFKKIRWVFWH